MAIKVLDATTDGVTSEWTVPLNSGPAASRDHCTVIVTSPPQGGPKVLIAFGVTPPANGEDAGQVDSNDEFDASYLVYTLTRYRDFPGEFLQGSLSNALGVLGGGNQGHPAPAAAVCVATFDHATGLVPTPMPAGGHVEVWVG